MPRRRETWDFHAPNGGKGNPTTSKSLTKLIERVEMAELKDHGAEAKDARALTEEEFISVIDESRKKVFPRETNLHKFAHPAFLLTQFHLDGRLDDISLLDTNELRPYPKQKDILQVSIRASKNIHKKTAWHFQCLIGCLNPVLCVIIAIAAYVGWWENDDDLKVYPGRITEKAEGEKKKEPILPGFFRLKMALRWGKSAISRRLKHIMIIILELIGNVSTHSIRKTSTEAMQNNKVIRDASDQRGRWKTEKTTKKRNASNIYHMSFLRYLDLEAAQGLCKAGCCIYIAENLTDEMVLNILPASKHLISGVGYILCCAALWAYANSPEL